MDFYQKSLSAKRCKNRNEVIISLRNSLLASQKLEYFNKKSSDFHRYPPSTKNVKLRYIGHASSSTPSGKYTESNSPSFSFSNLSRFDNTIFEKFKSIYYSDRYPVIIRLSSEEKNRQSQRFLLNQDMSQYSPEKKNKKLEEIHNSYEFTKNIVQLTKKNILENKKLNRESKLRLKFNKLEIRLNKNLFGDIKASWVILTVAFSCAQLMMDCLLVKKYLKFKCRCYWGKIRTFFYAFNRFLYILKRFRKKMKTLETYKIASKSIRVFLIQTNVNRLLLLDFIEYSINRGTLKALVTKFNLKIKLIQNSIRSFLMFRKNVYLHLVTLWKSIESRISLNKIGKKKKNSILAHNFLTPNSKILFIRSFIKSKVREYVRSLQAFKTSQLPGNQKPFPLDMLGTNFIRQITLQIESEIMPKRMSLKKNLTKKNN